MTKLQEQMLNKIALNINTIINGNEPSCCDDTLVDKK
jgi:hypothetical protein